MACTDSTTASDALTDAILSPVKASGDNQSVERNSLSELIEADKYLEAKCAVRNRKRGFRLTRIIPPGTV